MNKNINYNVNNKIYNVIFTDDILSQLNNRFKKIKSDKKICLVYDENIDNKNHMWRLQNNVLSSNGIDFKEP